jgi:hypothetical protein
MLGKAWTKPGMQRTKQSVDQYSGSIGWKLGSGNDEMSLDSRPAVWLWRARTRTNRKEEGDEIE